MITLYVTDGVGDRMGAREGGRHDEKRGMLWVSSDLVGRGTFGLVKGGEEGQLRIGI